MTWFGEERELLVDVNGWQISRVYVLLGTQPLGPIHVDHLLIRMILSNVSCDANQDSCGFNGISEAFCCESACIGGWHYLAEFRIFPERGSMSLLKLERTPCRNLHLDLDR